MASVTSKSKNWTFLLHEFFFLYLLLCANFFSWHFPLHDFFWVFSPPPPPPHHFSNGPSLNLCTYVYISVYIYIHIFGSVLIFYCNITVILIAKGNKKRYYYYYYYYLYWSPVAAQALWVEHSHHVKQSVHSSNFELYNNNKNRMLSQWDGLTFILKTSTSAPYALFSHRLVKRHLYGEALSGVSQGESLFPCSL